MRLIDAHRIESILTYTEFDRDNKPEWLESPVESYRHFMGIIQGTETAFDVDKVIEKLKEKSEDDSCGGVGGIWTEDAIEIIKSELKR